MTLTNDDLIAIKGVVKEETTKIVKAETAKIVKAETAKIVKAEIRNVVNSQSAMKSELLARINKLQDQMDKKFGDVDKKFGVVNKKIDYLTNRIDKIGLTVAHLEDDAPTVEEFDKLEKRVTKLEQKSLQPGVV